MFLREPIAKQVAQESQPEPISCLDNVLSKQARATGRARLSAEVMRSRLTSSQNVSDPRDQTAERFLSTHEQSQSRSSELPPKPSTCTSTSSIRRRLSKSQKDQNVKVFFKSLKKSSTLESVARVLSGFGQLKFVRLPFSKTKKRNMGYGYAIFEDASVAIDLLRTTKSVLVDGKPVAISSFSFAKSTSSPRNQAPFCFDQSAFSGDSELEGNDSELAGSVKPGLHAIKPTCSEFYLLRRSRSKLANSKNLRFSICVERKARAGTNK